MLGLEFFPVNIIPCLADFPRGDGVLMNPLKIIILAIAYLSWGKTLAWINQDARKVDFPPQSWNLIGIATGLVGLASFLVVPYFPIALLLFLLLFLAPTFVYVSLRNPKVPPPARVLTPEHFNRILASITGGGKGGEVVESGPRTAPPIRFFNKSNKGKIEGAEVRIDRAKSSPGYRYAEELVYEAIVARATDIHMEPTREEMTVRYRIDSIMEAVPSFSRSRGDTVLNVYKVLAGLDITEKRKPQDGSFSCELNGDKNIDFRVATAGSVNGEKMVIRILDASKQMNGIMDLQMRESMATKVQEIVHQPYGMFLTCGPTGAGKTSTLYAALHEIDRFQLNVITLENPVEYSIDNVTQIEINPKAGKTFATELRSILRQDPDVILVGEIRDAETAEIACQAAQTGHMVLSTVHANDTITAVSRLVDLGVKPFMVSSALSGILGQRLIRLLCPKCKVGYTPDREMLIKMRIKPERIKQFFRPPTENEDAIRIQGIDDEPVNNCPHCRGTGYVGRCGIFELLHVTTEIRDLIREKIDLTALRQAAAKQGMTSLLDDGLRKVIEGKTALSEIKRVAK
jgi:general secretion pathway protein E